MKVTEVSGSGCLMAGRCFCRCNSGRGIRDCVRGDHCGDHGSECHRLCAPWRK